LTPAPLGDKLHVAAPGAVASVWVKHLLSAFGAFISQGDHTRLWQESPPILSAKVGFFISKKRTKIVYASVYKSVQKLWITFLTEKPLNLAKKRPKTRKAGFEQKLYTQAYAFRKFNFGRFYAKISQKTTQNPPPLTKSKKYGMIINVVKWTIKVLSTINASKYCF